MQTIRPRITVIHLHYRSDWMEQFREVECSFEVDYVYTCYSERRVFSQEANSCREHAIEDFTCAQDLIAQLKPKAILLYSVGDGLYCSTVALAARLAQIPTAVFDHGIRLKVEFDSARAGPPVQINRPKHPHNLPFVLRSLRFSHGLDWLRLLAMQAMKVLGLNRYSRTLALFKDLRMSDAYICYSPYNTAYVDTDGTNGRTVYLTGIPNFDAFFQTVVASRPDRKRSFLFIDQPLGAIGDGYGAEGLNDWRVRALKLVEKYCLANCLQLLIRPHPFQPENDYEFLNTYDLTRSTGSLFREEVEQAEHVVGFCSTAMLPVLALRWAVVLGSDKIFNFDELFRAPAYRPLARYVAIEKFVLDDLEPPACPETGSVREQFVHQFLYRNDGLAQKRTAQAVAALCKAGGCEHTTNASVSAEKQ